MKYILTSIFLLIAFYSCEKDEETVVVDNTIIIRDTIYQVDTTLVSDTIFVRDTINNRDTIFYPAQNFVHMVFNNPMLEWNTIDSFLNRTGPSGSFQIPQPGDSTITVDIDLDNNSINELRFTFRHWIDVVSTSSPSVNYVPRKFSFHSLNNDFSFAYSKASNTTVTLFDANIEISTFASWSSSGQGYHIEHSIPVPLFTFTGTKYLSFRKKNGPNYYYGWLKVEYVKDFHFKLHEIVFNPNANMSLKTGQISL